MASPYAFNFSTIVSSRRVRPAQASSCFEQVVVVIAEEVAQEVEFATIQNARKLNPGDQLDTQPVGFGRAIGKAETVS